MKEEWKPIVGYEKRYAISTKGRVRIPGKVKTKGNHIKIKLGKLMKCHVNDNGYLIACLTNNKGEMKQFRVHRLMMLTFVGEVKGKPVVNHIDGNKLNNTLENLEWTTSSENNIHALRMGLRSDDNKKRMFHVVVGDMDFTALGAKACAKILHENGYFTDVSIPSLSVAINSSANKHKLYLGILKAEATDDPYDEPGTYNRCGIKGRKIRAYLGDKTHIEKGPAKMADYLMANGYVSKKEKRDSLLKVISAAAMKGKKTRGIRFEYVE